MTAMGAAVLLLRHQPGSLLAPVPADLARDLPGWGGGLANAIRLPLAALVGLGLALPALGTAEQISRAAGNLPQPRVRSLKRTLLVSAGIAVIAVAGSTAVFQWIVPAEARALWSEIPLIAIVRQLGLPSLSRELAAILMVGAAVCVMGFAAECGLADVIGRLRGLIDQGLMAAALGEPHPQFGTPWRLIDAGAAAAAVVVIASGGRVAWIAGAYGVVLAISCTLRLAALVRVRKGRPTAAGLHTPGVALLCAVLVAVVLAMLAAVGSSWSGVGAVLALSITLLVTKPSVDPVADSSSETFQLLPSTELSLDQVNVRPGGVLVAVRHPLQLGHLVHALRAVGDRDVAVVTVRLLGLDPDEDTRNVVVPTDAERRLFAEVIAIAERQACAVRLLIVPATTWHALVSAVIRMQSSEIFVGESSTLSAATQARLLGDAWERADKPDTLSARLVVHHHSTGRNDIYFLGAHAPRLTPQDIDLVHRLWLDVTKAVGPHVHHHDLVRAALVHMSNNLNSPQRDEALDLVRKLARPADELAAVVRQRDFPRLRDMLRNLPPSDVAEILAELSVADQAVVFRLLPRADAADAFEYLAPEAQASLIKGMAHEDVASLLNEMDPDDRTTFLEELPATVTRQLLTLLTPEERAVAIKLLGYPEGSTGRLMTPSYIAVREDWTVQQVLDHVRAHGQDSETLNVIYVVDDRGVLIDDIRIREFLLTSPEKRVSALMDRRFVALKATDSEDVAVSTFRQHDRVALPVTDTAGVLIGIVTIDDVLVVAEEKATKEIQRIGGSEALDEPYITIPFWRMIKKRAGWLTALFLGEMLTATAMSSFENEVAKAVVLSVFIPLAISSGGNAGSQASTLIIRAMALGEVTLKDWFRIMRKELATGFVLGAILGTVGFLRITITAQFFPIYTAHWMLVAITVGTALVGIVTWGSLVGSLLPLILRRLGFDPATSSAPFVATLVDVTGLIIYFSVGMVVLKGTLL
jgi:magnesium transporter